MGGIFITKLYRISRLIWKNYSIKQIICWFKEQKMEELVVWQIKAQRQIKNTERKVKKIDVDNMISLDDLLNLFIVKSKTMSTAPGYHKTQIIVSGGRSTFIDCIIFTNIPISFNIMMYIFARLGMYYKLLISFFPKTTLSRVKKLTQWVFKFTNFTQPIMFLLS